MIFLLVTTLYRGNFYVGGHESMHRYYAGKQEAIDVKKFFDSLHRWQYHLASIACLLLWGQMLHLVGKLPSFGKYIHMLG